MGLCTSKSTIKLDPSAQLLSIERASRAAGEGLSLNGTPILDEDILMVQPVKLLPEGTGARGGGAGGTKTGGAVNQTAKGYLEVGGKGGGFGEAPTSKELDEEEEDEEGNMVEELINISDSKGSLRSEFLDWGEEDDLGGKKKWKTKEITYRFNSFLVLLLESWNYFK